MARLRLAASASVVAVVVGLAGSTSPVAAQETSSQAANETAVSFSIPAQNLNGAILAFADYAGVQVFYDVARVNGLRSGAVQGRYSREQALATLLSGTGISYRFTGANAVSLVAPAGVEGGDVVSDGSTVLETITVVGAGNSVTEGTGSYTTGAMSTATRLPLSVHDTPQSLSVVTRQKMDDQGMQTLDDVAKNTTGIANYRWSNDRSRYMARGFLINSFLLDGVPVTYEMDTATYGTLAMYDHVEVVRGATGLMTGMGDPSGTINLVRKRATTEPQYSVTTRAGSWDDYSTMIDLSRPLNDEGTLRGRFVTSLQDKDNFTEDYGNRRQLYYGTTEFDLTENTTLRIGGHYNREDTPGSEWTGWPTAPDGSFLGLPRSTRFSPSWSRWDREETSAFAELEHRFDNGWSAKLTGRMLNQASTLDGTFFAGARYDASGNPAYDVMGGYYEYDKKQFSIDASVQGPVTLFDREHDLAFGISRRQNTWHDTGFSYLDASGSYDLATGVNPHTWDPNSLDKDSFTNEDLWTRDQDSRLTSAWTTGRFNILDPLHVLTGGRLDWYSYENHQKQGTWSSDRAAEEKGHFTPFGAVVYDLTDNYSAYVSYASIFKPQDYTDTSGTLLDPVNGTNYEVGLKATFLDERINGSVALFHTTQENLPRAVSDLSLCAIRTNCYEAVGEVESKGIDIDLNGELLPRLNVALGYTFTQAEITKDAGSGAVGSPYASYIPQHMFKLSAMYHLPDAYEQWRVGGSVRWQSKITSESSAGQANLIVQDPVAIADVVVGYKVNDNFDIQLNVNNVFDTRYYESVMTQNVSNFLGTPRSFLLTAKATF
ncbi:TonB-dependent siderophore receptor [Shinella sp.]|uniref:TonB-dependent siderophore receptor n=1 Tax=Shinella sp. TaxID=1870904 RepID=UPI003F6EEB7B